MTVALVLAAEADAGLRGQLAALGVRRVDAAERAGSALLTVAAAARTAGERVLICTGDDAVPDEILARLLAAGGTAAFTGMRVPDGRAADGRAAKGRAADGRAAEGREAPHAQPAGALVVDTRDLAALAGAAESLAARHVAPAAVGALLRELARRGVGRPGRGPPPAGAGASRTGSCPLAGRATARSPS
jgi:hypothetical protein